MPSRPRLQDLSLADACALLSLNMDQLKSAQIPLKRRERSSGLWGGDDLSAHLEVASSSLGGETLSSQATQQ